MKFASKLALAALCALCNWAFAEPDVQEVVPPVEAVPQLEPAKDSVVKHRFLFNAGYLDGMELSFVKEGLHEHEEKDNPWNVRYGPGIGVIAGAESSHFPLFFNVHLGWPKGDFEYFLNNRVGISLLSSKKVDTSSDDEYYIGYDEEDETCSFCTFFYEPSVGIQYNNFSLSLGYNFFSGDYKNSFTVRLGYRAEMEVEIKPEPKVEEKVSEAPKEEKKSARFFRPGIELNYPFWRSSVDYFENSSPNAALGAGIFLRIGPDGFYFTTGAYAKVEVLERHETKDLGAFGIKITELPLMDLYWLKTFVEVPLLLSFGSGQIRFSFGALLDFYANSEFTIEIADGISEKLSDKATEAINEKFNKTPDGEIYYTLGLDFDIVRHWGLGIKFLVWGSSFGEEKSLIEPARCQTRVSTYFVF